MNSEVESIASLPEQTGIRRRRKIIVNGEAYDPEHPPKVFANDERPTPMRCGGLMRGCCTFFGILIGFIVYVFLMDFLFGTMRLLNPPCSRPYGRLCNDRGSCVNGVCECDSLFSGPACTDTQIPGYDVVTGIECSGNGFAYPFISVPPECAEQFDSKGMIVEGTGWASEGCVTYVTVIRSNIQFTDGNTQEALGAATIPNCLCDIGYLGLECLSPICPRDENGLVCGGNGNTSVGLVNNFTNAGNGCQCADVFALYEPQYLQFYDQEALDILLQRYYFDFNKLYCGHIAPVTDALGARQLNQLFLYTTSSDYVCHCTEDWKGEVCTEGRCPANLQTKAVCSGNGHPEKGTGKLVNVTYPRANGRPCSLQCDEGYSKCNGKCYADDGGQFSLIYNSGFCNSRNRCSANQPIRCPDGTCASIPTPDYDTCNLGWVYGSIDYARLDQSVFFYKCDNITNIGAFERCFRNTTEVPGVTGYLNEGGGGVFLNYTENSTSITVDLGSPLVYFQLVTNNSGILITNFNGDILSQDEDGFFSGLFQYEEYNTWQAPVSWISTLSKVGDNLFIVDPVPWNYSAVIQFNESFATFRLKNDNLQLAVIVEAVESQIEITLVTEWDPAVTYQGILIQVPEDDSLQPLWLYPTNALFTNAECLSIPAECSWYIEPDFSSIRSLDDQLYVCYNVDNTTLIAQTAVCGVSAIQLLAMFPTSFYTFRTTLDVNLPNLRDYDDVVFLTYELVNPDQTEFPFTIAWTVVPEDGVSIILQDVAFLTLDRGITFPCACDTTSFQTNQSTFNDRWWSQNNTRQLTDFNVVPGDKILATVYPLGEKEYVRGTVTEVNTEDNVVTVFDDSTSFNTSVYYVDARKISNFEITEGLDDCQRIRKPFRCPNGHCTTASSEVQEVDVACNCTFTFDAASDTPYSFNCTCSDDDITPNYWGCACNSLQCSCGSPADSEFQRDLLALLSTVTSNQCSCIYYEGSTSINDTYIELTNVNDPAAVFQFDLDTIPLALTIILDTCGVGEIVYVFGESTLFSNITLVIETEEAHFSLATCEYVFNLYLDPGYVLSNVTVLVDGANIVNTTLINTIYGVSVTQMDSARHGPPTFTASSNSADAPNVNDWGYNMWESSTSLRENPVWIQVDYMSQYYVSTIVMLFSRAGITVGEFAIPAHVYLQGSNNETNWYTLSNWDVYVNDTPVFIQSNVTTNETFSKYRLISYGQGFGLRYWQLYAQSACNCTDTDLNLVLKLESSEGLLSVETQYTDMLYRLANLQPNVTCVCSDDCTIYNEDVTNNGVCNDVLYVAATIGVEGVSVPVNETLNYIGDYVNIGAPNGTYVFDAFTFIPDVLGSGYDAVQFSTLGGSDYISDADVIAFLEVSQGLIPLYNGTSGLSIFYLETGSLIFICSSTDSLWAWANQTMYFYFVELEGEWTDLLTNQLACSPGSDCTDCGPGNRIPVLFPGYTCQTNTIQTDIMNGLTNGNIIFSRSFLLLDYQNVSAAFTGHYENLRLTRSVTRMQLDHCTGQTCPLDTPFKCLNGRCVQRKADCDLRYDCPGNGCIELLDSSIFGAFRCACKSGFAGDACQYGSCRPATPFLGPGDTRTPASEECACGGPPPFRLKPPVLNTRETYDTEELETLNRKVTPNSSPLSSKDKGYFRVMPIHAPWGQVITRRKVLPGSDTYPIADRTIYTTCPCARRGYREEYYLMTDDIKSKNIFTGEPVWKEYTNPTTGEPETFPWLNGICTYDEFPYRCANGQCVANQVECIINEQQFPLCNNRGECRADGTCACASPYRTFMISVEYSQSIFYPYTYNKETKQSEPTVWDINYNWRYHGLNQCTARNCQLDTCKVPKGCFSGTPSLDFRDRFTLCQKVGLCAPNENACYSGVGLVQPLTCTGNGIKRVKDVTGEEYCACGTPISPLIQIEGVSQLTQLKKNGYGGPACDQYYADTTTILMWSSWNYAVDQPYKSKVTGETLPGIWIKGNIIMGPRPEDRLLWDKCCQGYDRLELCPFVPCNIQAEVQCVTPTICLSYSATAPLLYPCNGHGVARADGTCLCDVNEAEGEGYTHDFTQFSDNGCYRFVRCPKSQISGESCNYVSQCGTPEEWRYPFPFDNYLEQQWFTCSGATGPYTNLTKLEKLSVDPRIFDQQVLQSLGKIAERVLGAIADLQGCICIMPTDTDTDRCCMVDNDRTYIYDQNFKSPYLLELGSDIPLLVDGLIEPLLTNVTAVVLDNGDTAQFYLFNNVSTRVSAIRVFGQGPGQLEFRNSANELVCLSVPLEEDIATESLGLMNWVAGNIGGAYDCGPTYECVQSRDFPLYETFCGERVNRGECRGYLETACIEDGFTYWPTDSDDIYHGCNRVDDINTCTCCQLLSQQALVTDGVIEMTVVGNATLGQVRLYGYTDTALVPPQGFLDILNRDYKGEAECQDDRYMRSQLNADKTYFSPLPSSVGNARIVKSEAAQICKNSGGYLAIGRLSGGNQALALNELSRACANIGVDNPSCWINAVGLYNDSLVARDIMFNPNTCTKYGCFTVNTQDQFGVFYVRNETKYKQKEAGLSTAQPIATLVTRLDAVQLKYGYPLMYLVSSRRTGPNSVNIEPSNYAVISYTTRTNTAISQIKITDDPYKAATESNTYLFGEAFYRPAGEIVTLLSKSDVYVRILMIPETFCAYNEVKDIITAGGIGQKFNLDYGLGKFQATCISRTTAAIRALSTAIDAGTAATAAAGECQNVVASIERLIGGVTYPVNANVFVADNDPSYSLFPNLKYQITACTSPPPDSATCGGLKLACPACVASYCISTGGLTSTPSCTPLKNIPIKTDAMQYPCWMAVKYFGTSYVHTSYASVHVRTNRVTRGTLGIDKQLGYTSHPYMPLFAYSTVFPGSRGIVNDAGTFFQAARKDAGILTLPSSPLYINTAGLTTWRTGVGYFPFPNVALCNLCILPIHQFCYWDQLYYSASENAWLNQFECPGPSVHLQLPGSFGGNPTPLVDFEVPSPALFVHQTNFIQNKTLIPNPLVTWYLPDCMSIVPNNTQPLRPAVCNHELHNYICSFDWTKYAVQTGLQCDECGPSTRTGAGPLPNVTCYDDNPLANATLFPFEHMVKDAYVRGTLDLLAASINIDPETIEFGNQSVIMGIDGAWGLWADGFSSRPGATSVNVDENPQSWCDMCLECNWPVDCGAQVDPQTNLIERFCAVRSDYCNLNFNESAGSFIQMIEGDIPKTIFAVDPLLSFVDQTCGPVVLLSSYAATDKYGGSQSDLIIYSQILRLTSSLIEIEVASPTPLWFNGGKTNTDYVFEWNVTATISGTYTLDLCPLCVDPIMEVIIYPLNIAYAYPAPILAVNVSLDVGEQTLYAVNFTVTEADTGVFVVQGESYPEIVFRGVGFRFYNVDIGSSIVLTNPVITDEVTRQQCETRVPGTWYEPRFRIRSAAPLRRCIITDSDLELFPGTTLGQCACDLSTAGRTCDCPAVTSKYGKQVCGGYGDPTASVLGPDGNTYVTGTDDETGCYIWDGDGRKYADCKTVDVGRSLFTLLVDNAVFDYPSVYIETIPIRDSSLFRNLDDQNPDFLDFNDTKDLCETNGLFLPYYYTSDELSQLISVTRNTLPVFMGVDIPNSNETHWPWLSINAQSYFLLNPTTTTVSVAGTCSPSLSCSIVNFNNFAYGSVVTGVGGAALVDGNTNSGAPSPTTFTISWTRPSEDIVRIYLFDAVNANVASKTCGASAAITDCTAVTDVSPDSYFDCRCPFRSLSITFTLAAPTEIQIFSASDLLRSDTYTYN